MLSVFVELKSIAAVVGNVVVLIEGEEEEEDVADE